MCLFCFVLLFCFFVCLQRTEHALECCVTRMPHVKTWFKDQLVSVMMDTKGLGQNALVSGSIVCQIVKRHLIAHIASVKDQLLKELCYTICYLFKLLELKAHQFNSKNNGPCLLLNTIFKHWSCFLSSVAKDDRDGDGLKLSVDFSPKRDVRRWVQKTDTSYWSWTTIGWVLCDIWNNQGPDKCYQAMLKIKADNT